MWLGKARLHAAKESLQRMAGEKALLIGMLPSMGWKNRRMRAKLRLMCLRLRKSRQSDFPYGRRMLAGNVIVVQVEEEATGCIKKGIGGQDPTKWVS